MWALLAPALLLAALCALGAALTTAALPYPGTGGGSGGSYEGWTGESSLNWPAPRHVQSAWAGGCLYVVADDGSDVRFARSLDGGLSFGGSCVLDHNPADPARDAYLVAWGDSLAVSWKEMVAGRWALVVAFSSDRGQSWRRYLDANPSCDNYEAHLAYAGGKVHGAYVSNSSGQNEVYYRRWSERGDLEVDWRRVSDEGGCPDTQPCIEAGDALCASVYYRHEDQPCPSIYQGYTLDGGLTWHRQLRIYTPSVESSWPECVRYGDHVTLVCQAYFGSNYAIQFTNYDGSSWTAPSAYTGATGTKPTFPQVSASGSRVLVCYRDSGGTSEPLQRVSAIYSDDHFMEGKHTYVNQLFFGNISYDNPGSVDVTTDGNRFYALSAGTGASPRVMVKREDAFSPQVRIKTPSSDPSYVRESPLVEAEAADDWSRDDASLLSPQPEAYQSGVLHMFFRYRPRGEQAWRDFPGGGKDDDAPWGKPLDISALPDGVYEVQVEAVDTAMNRSSAVLRELCVDRIPPAISCETIGGQQEEGTEWFKSPPMVKATFSDQLSGVNPTSLKYRVDQGEWTAYPTEGIVAEEGIHRYYFACEDRAGNTRVDETGFEVRVDTRPPAAEATLPNADGKNGWRRSDAAATVTLSASDQQDGSGLAGIRYGWDSAPGQAYAGPLVAPEGAHRLYYQARDLAGNWSEPFCLEVRKDTVPPRAEIILPTGENWLRGMVTVQATVEDNCEVGCLDFLLDGDPFDHREAEPWTASLDTTAWGNGYHTLTVRAEDAAGNTGSVEGKARMEVFIGNNISETNNFAEGCTRQGFETWLCLQNPGDEDAGVTVNYMLGPGQGTAGARNYAVPRHSRVTILVNNDVGAGKDVSIQVTSSKPIVSERPMYFEYGGTGGYDWKGCHTAQGVSLPRQEWYLAEGCTREGFEEWICLQNPGDSAADVGIDFMLGDGRVINRSYRVERWQRYTVLVNQEVGPGQDVSAHITSSVPVVVERPMYFLYQGMWDGGHNVMGAHQPEREWYFAEGCTRPGFNQWLCVQNPNGQAAQVKVEYMTEDGGLISKEYGVGAHSRFTINVNNDVPRYHDVSSRLESTLPVVVERPMYFIYGDIISEGSNAMGVNRPCSTWYLAEGCTREGFEEWICLQNPGGESAAVRLRFMLEDGRVIERSLRVEAGFRVTLKVNDCVGAGHDVSTEVLSDRPVVCERPMYAHYAGRIPAADTLAGYSFEK